jgi:hypothetical protein
MPSLSSWRAWGVGACCPIALSRVHLLALAILLGAASSCASTPVGEFTAEACTNGDDDDRDMLRDCDDPDCWVFCPVRVHEQVGDPSSSDLSDASADAGDKPAADSGKPSAIQEEDAGQEPVDAATADDDSGAPNGCDCPAGQSCVEGECRPKPSPTIAGMYTLTVQSAYVPFGPSDDRCFDYSGAACIARILFVCECERPDPYVVVLQNKTVLSRATTTEVRDTLGAQWSPGMAPSVTITLKATDTLTFRAFDWDGLGQDQPIFDCMPDLSVLASGADALSCNPRPGTTATPPAGGSYSITVKAVRVVPATANP